MCSGVKAKKKQSTSNNCGNSYALRSAQRRTAPWVTWVTGPHRLNENHWLSHLNGFSHADRNEAATQSCLTQPPSPVASYPQAHHSRIFGAVESLRVKGEPVHREQAGCSV